MNNQFCNEFEILSQTKFDKNKSFVQIYSACFIEGHFQTNMKTKQWFRSLNLFLYTNICENDTVCQFTFFSVQKRFKKR